MHLGTKECVNEQKIFSQFKGKIAVKFLSLVKFCLS